MKLFWYWPHPHRTKNVLVDSVFQVGDSFVVQALAGYRGVPLPPVEAPYVVHRELPDPTRGRPILNTSRRLWVRHRGVRRFDPDIVHLELLEYRFDWAFAPLLRGWSRHRRLTAAVHDVRPHVSNMPVAIEAAMHRRLYRSFDALVVFHDSLRRQLIDEFGVSADRVHVIAPAIVSAPGAHGRLASGNGDVVFFGTFRANKGIDLLVEAIAPLPELPGRRFVFAGTGDPTLEDRVRSLVASRNDTDCEIDQLSNARVDELLSAARVLVLPYTTFSSQSGVLIDAYRHGVPLIVTDVGALGETVSTDETGWVVQPGDVGALRRAIEEARQDDEAIDRYANAIAVVIQHHEPRTVGAALRAVLDSHSPVQGDGPGRPTSERPTVLRRFRVHPPAATATIRKLLAHPSNRGQSIRALARVCRCEGQARLTGRAVVTRLGERSRIYAHLHGGGSWRAVLANPPDHAEMTVWRRELRHGDLFVDVGAHAGVYSIWALEMGASAVAIEPVPALVAQLRKNLALNGYEAEVHQVAVADRVGNMGMTGPDLLRGHLVLGRNPLPESGSEVEVRTLDDIIGERTVAGLKIDVEGAERLVLEGAERLLREQRVRLLQIEWNGCSRPLLGEDRQPVATLLRDRGYELCRPSEDGMLVATDDFSDGPDMFARLRANG